jgi:inorganic pyrophosphatase
MNVIIEIPKFSNIKYEYDENENKIIVDRFLHNTNIFPYNYGYVPNTLSPDGDPIDVILLCDYSLFPGCQIKCKVIGAIETSDEKGQDDKIICVPIDKIDPKSKNFNDIEDIYESELNMILYFLRHYKDNENKK